MKTKQKMVKLEIEVPEWAYNRITKYLREELEIVKPESVVGKVMVGDLLGTWKDDVSIWLSHYFYPDRKTAVRVVNRYFSNYPGACPMKVFYEEGVGRFETVSNQYKPTLSHARR